MIEVDLNSDMGEGLSPWTIGDGVGVVIMPLISNANIAIGFHAGNPSSMRRTVEMAAEYGVAISAHPDFRNLVGFGRQHIAAPAIELVNDMLYQLDALREFARLQGLSLQRVKPHGVLYIHLVRDEVAARLFVETLQRLEPGLLLYCMPGSVTWRIGQELGQPLVRELYVNRDYDRSGSIVFTRRVAALDPQRVAGKVLCTYREGKVCTVEGEDLDIAFDSVCIHSDTPGALELVVSTRARLEGAGTRIKAPRWAPLVSASLATSFPAISHNVRIMRIRHGRT